MVSLKTVGERFYLWFDVIEGGIGKVRGLLSETEQQSQPSYVFVQPRHIFRTPQATALKAGMVIRSQAGDVFIVGENGPSEQRAGVLWQSFRLFEATGQYVWSRQGETKDAITNLPRNKIKPDTLGLIWCALEPLDREQSDREMRVSFEQRRVITGAAIQSKDLVGNHTVTKVDKQLGVSIGVLT